MILNEYGTIANREWEKLDKRFTQIELDEYILMPNHMHGFIIISDAVGTLHELPLRESEFENAIQEDATAKNSPIIRRRMILPMVIGFYKMNTAKAINSAIKTRNRHLWQRNYCEHVIRNEDSLNRIQRYIQENPTQWPTDSENRYHATRS